jgi:uncharacterized protein YidB (DUF937 family)
MAVLGGVVLAQQNSDESAPEPAAVEEASPSSGTTEHPFGVFEHFRDGEHGHFADRFSGQWHHGDDHGPGAYLADILGISTEELRDALADGQTLAEIATANGLTRQELIDALLAQADGALQLAATAGILDDAQIAFVQDWLNDGVELVVDHPLPVGEAWWELHTQDWHTLLDAEDYDLSERLAELMGVTLEELVDAMLDGASLADVAEANDLPPQDVVNFLVAEAEAELAEALAAGYLTEAQAEVLGGWVEDGIARIVDNSFMLPNAVDLLERLEDIISLRFPDHRLPEIDWQGWFEFDWAAVIGQDPISVAAGALGLSRGELLVALAEGQVLTEIAEASGVDVQTVVDAQTGALTDLLDSLVEQGLLPADKLDRIMPFLGPAMQMLADNGLPFAGDWDGLHGFGRHWDDRDTHRLRDWLNCCPCGDESNDE